MSIAYLVLAHNAPAQLARLVSAIHTPDTDVWIHLDKKSDAAKFMHLQRDGVRFLAERHAVFWGDYSQVEAILALVRTALNAERRYSRLVLLSGSDYPIRSSAYIEQFFARQPDIEFMNMAAMPCEQVGKPLSRVNSFWPRRSRPWSRVETKLRRAAVRFGLLSVERDHQRYLRGLQPFGGSTWWALTRAACEYAVRYVDSNPAFVRFYSNTVYPDELMLHTILGNSSFRPSVRHNVTYTDWSRGGSNPATLDTQHLRDFALTLEVRADDAYGKAELLFARKFSDDAGPLITEIDAMREAKDRPATMMLSPSAL